MKPPAIATTAPGATPFRGKPPGSSPSALSRFDKLKALSGAEGLRAEGRGEPHLACANPEACRSCPRKAQCTTGAHRRITRWEGEAIVEAMPARVAAHPGIIAQRKAIVEHPFGSIKFWQEQRAFLLRLARPASRPIPLRRLGGLEKVRGEFHLGALACNMKRVINLVGMERPLEAVRRLAVATAQLLEALLNVRRARWPPNEAQWPLAA